MPPTLRSYDPHDFAALFKLDQSCFPAGISYSRTTLRYFLTLPSAHSALEEETAPITVFFWRGENPPPAHIIPRNLEKNHRRKGGGPPLPKTQKENPASRGVPSILLKPEINNEAAV